MGNTNDKATETQAVELSEDDRKVMLGLFDAVSRGHMDAEHAIKIWESHQKSKASK